MRCDGSVTHACRNATILSHAVLRNVNFTRHLMAMPAAQLAHRWTAEEVRALPDEPGKRFECVDGELLVSPSPRLPHQSLVGDFHMLLKPYARAQGIGAAFMAPGDLELDPFTLVQPDVYVLPLVEGRPPRTASEIGQALLLIEVLSPSTARYDRVVKRARYQRYGVEYWIVDPEARLVERWLPDVSQPFIHTESITWAPSGCDAPLTIDLQPLFVEALGPQ